MNFKKTITILGIFLIFSYGIKSETVTIAIEWLGTSPCGSINIKNGTLEKINILKGEGVVDENNFCFSSNSNRVAVTIDDANRDIGANTTIISVQIDENPFTFFLRDVSTKSPIYIPDYRCVVLLETDRRTYSEIEQHIKSKNLRTKIQHIDKMHESTFSSLATKTRDMSAPTWLGIGRDFRIFEVSECLADAEMGEANLISPKYAATSLNIEEVNGRPLNYMFSVGRGVGVYNNLHRHLENGYLPILNSRLQDDDILYHSRAFVGLEKSSLDSLTGTHFLVAAKYSAGPANFTEEQEQEIEKSKNNYLNAQEETVLFYRVEALNTGLVPRYAWFRSPSPGNGWHERYPYNFNPENGFSTLPSGTVFCMSKLNGKPLSNDEISILLQPGEKAVFEFRLPHQPISMEKAHALSSHSIDSKLIEIISYWEEKINKAAKISVPEERINEMIQAGLLHLDLITYGLEPGGVLAPNVGVYSPIGTESAPIIQYFASVGLKDLAKRSLLYFFEKQREDGFMQNFGGYMAETGAVLWTLGEYFRYYNDIELITELEDKIYKSCIFLINWKNRNKTTDLVGRGYGMIDGKVADPEDHFHQFMLNGYAYLGLNRMAEALLYINSKHASYIKKSAEELKSDIRESLFNALALSPVVPLGDGRWVSSLPPWTEADGPRSLYQKNERFWSHGTFTVADAMLGPMHLVFCEIIDINEPLTENIIDYNSELFYQNNSVFSQPYYSRHNWVQAKRGMIKPFLNTYYATMSGHADRETYTFWEHAYRVSPHKTHEEAWFLMETRWMLYLEDGDTLKLLNTIPRNWTESGKTISLENARSYFGILNLNVTSFIKRDGHGSIEVDLNVEKSEQLKKITLRLPHPHHMKPVKVVGGTYDADKETVLINPSNNKMKVILEF